MTFSFTGLSYLLAFLALGLLTYRFFQYWRREKTTISKLFFCFAGLLALFMLITAIAGLFFAKNTPILKASVISSAFLQTLSCATIGYLIIYMKFPKISPWFGFSVVFLLGLPAIILTIIIPFQPFLEETGAINWDLQPLANTFRSSILLVTFIPLSIILIQQFRATTDPDVRAKSLGLSFALIFGLIAGLLDFFLESVLKMLAISSDIVFGFLSIILFIVFFLTQKSPSSKKEFVYPSSSPKLL